MATGRCGSATSTRRSAGWCRDAAPRQHFRDKQALLALMFARKEQPALRAANEAAFAAPQAMVDRAVADGDIADAGCRRRRHRRGARPRPSGYTGSSTLGNC
jgi:hypothetical protein